MIYGFDTADEDAATAAVLVYAIYRSRDYSRFKVTPDLWGQVERFVKDAAKRSKTLPEFLEALKPRLSCASIKPRWMAVGLAGEAPIVPVTGPDGRLSYAIQLAGTGPAREFLTGLLERADRRGVLDRLYRETAWIVLLVRDRLEREKPIEDRLDAEIQED